MYLIYNQPLFNNKCVACHNEIIKGGLNMTTSLNLLDGGKSGAAIVPKIQEKFSF